MSHQQLTATVVFKVRSDYHCYSTTSNLLGLSAGLKAKLNDTGLEAQAHSPQFIETIGIHNELLEESSYRRTEKNRNLHCSISWRYWKKHIPQVQNSTHILVTYFWASSEEHSQFHTQAKSWVHKNKICERRVKHWKLRINRIVQWALISSITLRILQSLPSVESSRGLRLVPNLWDCSSQMYLPIDIYPK